MRGKAASGGLSLEGRKEKKEKRDTGKSTTCNGEEDRVREKTDR